MQHVDSKRADGHRQQFFVATRCWIRFFGCTVCRRSDGVVVLSATKGGARRLGGGR